MATIQRILLRDLAARLGCELRGDPDVEITGVAGMEQAGPTEITFLANPKYAPKLRHTQAGAVLVSGTVEGLKTRESECRINPYHDFARALALAISRLGRHPELIPKPLSPGRQGSAKARPSGRSQ